MIQLLAGLSSIEFTDTKPEKSIGTVGNGYEAFILMDENIDRNTLLLHFNKDLESEKAAAKKIETKLAGKFSQFAPQEVVQSEKDNLQEINRRIEKLQSYIQVLV